MNFEDLQKTWQAQAPGARVTVDAEVLLKEVRRNQRQFAATIFWRDLREMVVCLAMAVFFSVWGAAWHWWSLYFLGACNLFVAGCFIIDRARQRGKLPARNDTLRACTERSWHQVNHQIWLLTNIFWWYLLPILVGLGAVVAQLVWSMHTAGRDLSAIAGMAGFYLAIYTPVYAGVYWLNQRVVRKQLMPRREELEQLLAGLE